MTCAAAFGSARMSSGIAIALSIFAILQSYRNGLAAEFNQLQPNLLVVQANQSFGENLRLAASRVRWERAVERDGDRYGCPRWIDDANRQHRVQQSDSGCAGIDLKQYTDRNLLNVQSSFTGR